jgi:CRISPR-associated protein Cmr5
MSNIKGIEQGRAAFAFDCATAAKAHNRPADLDVKKDTSCAKEYKSYSKKIPMMIKTNGLGATVAFIFSKKEKESYKLLYKDIANWFKKTENLHFALNNGELVDEIIKLESAQYRAATNETLALFNWLRRFTEGLISGEADNND